MIATTPMQSTRPTQAMHAPTDLEAIEFLNGFVAQASLSGCEAPAAALFATAAARWGFESAIDEAGNAIATRRSERPDEETLATIVLLGHVDTVPGHIPVRIENGVLHGRGSVDAKGPLAAMLVAAARADLPPGVCVHVVGAVGEETPLSPGARFIASRLTPDACIIGEPSHADGVTLGYKGRLVLNASVVKPCAHSAGPGASAADVLLSFWNVCTVLVQRLNIGHAGAFNVIQATVQQMKSESDGLNATATMQCGFRLPPWLAPADLESHIRNIAAAFDGVQLRATGRESAVASDRNDLVVRCLTTAIRESGARPRPTLKTGTSDMNVVAPIWKCPIAAYGPGDSALDHTPEERLSLDEYAKSIRVLAAAIRSICLELVSSRSET